LVDDLDQALSGPEPAPRVLALYDLDGFKLYNDTFGHPAGDAMLSRMGEQLRDAVEPKGIGYRSGGDEFVVLIEGEGDRDRVAKRAAEALTARGTDYDLGAAWGLVSVPEEAETPAAAMQLADVRMYAQKESRRLAEPSALGREALQQGH
ncbi:MAG TPA: GGDEF domain-containing protein, partial [Solirubrobacterales bacterium]